jgi:SanA protein
MMKTMKMKLFALLLLIATPLLLILAIDGHVKSEASNYIVRLEDAPQADAILVLGAKVRPDGSVSDILGDRLKVALALEAAGKSDKFMSAATMAESLTMR